ncbi:HD domain-containing protein [Anaeromicropila herbilytica]|uniref:HD domain-containing protein n=1 Tax=Anaeromicropila herbilytica TaxID=2785025 RepID=A0A7R7EKJ7_9FIRM|nr:HD domain-containing protein [Anaeromicropila herbilytica]BCN30581.1 hypothetical protein bsdtb5_18760 [Anaeromicropila herbilytica]
MKVNRKIDNKYNNRITQLAVLLYVVTISVITVTEMLLHGPIDVVIKVNLVGILFLFTFFAFLREYQLPIINEKGNIILCLIGYSVSLILILISNRIHFLPIWMIGSIFIAMYWDSFISIYFHMMFCIMISLVQSIQVEHVLYSFILGFILCIFITRITSVVNMGYLFIVLCSVNIVINLVNNDFIFNISVIEDSAWSGFGILMILLLGYIFTTYIKVDNKNHYIRQATSLLYAATKEDSNHNLAEIDHEYEQSDFEETIEKNQNYGNILQDDFVLLLKMREMKIERYYHALEVSELCYEVANYLNIDKDLAKVSGLYHEFCQIIDKEDRTRGANLMFQYDFPKPAVDIILQQYENPKRPKSMEALVVFLSESIITTIDYLKQNARQKDMKHSRIIENVFNNHLTNGLFDNLTLSVQDYKRLKEFYLDYFKEDQ